jgi:hypothetical protein
MIEYYAKITAVNGNEIHIKDYKTGYTEKLIAMNSKITVLRQRDIDDVPLGTPVIAAVTDDKVMQEMYLTSVYLKAPKYETYGYGERVTAEISAAGDKLTNKFLLSKDKSRRYIIRTKEKEIDINSGVLRPLVFDELEGGFDDLKPGLYGYFKYNDDKTLISAYIEDFFPFTPPYWACVPSGPSGVTLAAMQKSYDKVLSCYDKVKAEVKKLMPVSFSLTPGLAKQNEPVTLNVSVISDKIPNNKLTYYSDYFKNDFSEYSELLLDWNKTADGYKTQITLPSRKNGQHLVKWKCDIGGDIDEYSRSYAVIDSSYTVVMLNNLSCPSLRSKMHEYYMPFSTWEFTPIESISQKYIKSEQTLTQPEYYSNASRECRQYGISPSYLLLYYGWGGYQTREEAPEFQRFVLKANKDIAELCGFDTKYINFGDYGMGRYMVEAAREMGYRYIHSLCTNHHIDGSFGINQLGKPDRPYFISSDDYRKPEREEKPILGFSQLQWNNPLAIKFFSHYCTGCGEFYDCDYTSVQAQENPKQYFSRVYDQLLALYDNAASQVEPYFLQFNFQFENKGYFVKQGNDIIFEYHVEMAKTRNVVFAAHSEVSDFYYNHVTAHPESVMYLPDVYCGMTRGDKPVNYPDTLQLENEELMAVHLRGELLADTLFDYSTFKNYEDCGNMQIPRSKSQWGTVVDPDNIYKYEITPRVADTRDFDVTEVRDANEITVTVNAKRNCRNLTVSLWDIGYSEYGLKIEGDARFVKAVAPYTNQLNGILICNVSKGTNIFKVTFGAEKRIVKANYAELGNVGCKVFERDEVNAYFWNLTPFQGALEIIAEPKREAYYYLSPLSEKKHLVIGKIEIPSNEKLVINGLTLEELKIILK